MPSTPETVIRPARPEDIPTILRLIRDLAEYEKALDSVEADEDQLAATLFADSPAVFCDLAETDGVVVGFVVWFLSYSTWQGRHGIYLEDLYVDPARRGQGHGKRLLAHLARRCAERGYGRLEWACLDWNTPSLDFYRSLGAVSKDDWITLRLDGAALERLGG